MDEYDRYNLSRTHETKICEAPWKPTPFDKTLDDNEALRLNVLLPHGLCGRIISVRA